MSKKFVLKKEMFQGRSVVVEDGDVNRALNLLRKKLKKGRILEIYAEKQAYVKPSTRKREKMQKAIRNQLKDSKENC